MLAAVQECLDAEASHENPMPEFNAYLKAPLTRDVDDLVAWWGVCISCHLLTVSDSLNF